MKLGHVTMSGEVARSALARSPADPHVPGQLPALPLCVVWFWELVLPGVWVPWAGMT